MDNQQSFSEMFEARYHSDPFHVAKGIIEKEFAITGRFKVPEALKHACAEELRFLSLLATEEIKYRKDKWWTRRKQQQLEEYYMFEWQRNHEAISQAIGNGTVQHIQGNVREVSEYIQAIVNVALIRYEMGDTRILDSDI